MRQKDSARRTKQKLVQALRRNLTRLEHSPSVRSLEDGEMYVCAVCNMRVKACELHAGAMCCHKIRDESPSWFLEEALRDPDRRSFGVCISCGKPLAATQMRRSPDSELCPQCRTRTHRLRGPRS